MGKDRLLRKGGPNAMEVELAQDIPDEVLSPQQSTGPSTGMTGREFVDRGTFDGIYAPLVTLSTEGAL